jgi:dipeptidyl aminopeptidase/acylaminoacyl peptidase
VAAVAPYGSWRSPITAEVIAAGVLRLEHIAVDGDDIYWSEGRPSEGGRCAIVRATGGGHVVDIIPPPFSARSRVHEYGGGAFTVAGGVVYFSNFTDGRIYRRDAGRAPEPITPEGPLRYADFIVDAPRGRLVAVREDHSAGGREAVNALVAIPLDPGHLQPVLVEGHDFYSTPRLSPDGTRLAWLAWNHPNMPWDGSELWVAEVEPDGALTGHRPVAGSADESIFQPEWSPAGVLHFVSDRTGWWNLYRWRAGAIEALCPMEAEFGKAQWGFGMATYAFVSPDQLVCVVIEHGRERLARLDSTSGKLTTIDTPHTVVHDPRAAGGRVVCRAASPTSALAIVRLDPTTGQIERLREGSTVRIADGYLSVPRAIEFPTTGGLTAHGLFYPPRNDDHAGPPGQKPPLIVLSHGGPTGATASNLNPGLQYWTSRGFALLDVNYGGSTGYGRAYRQRLDGRWGEVDVDDCVNGARWLADHSEVDGGRLVIRGSSAGGYTTLSALTFRDTFKAGASYFGIGDLERLALDTHKLESRYLDRLVGPYPARRDLYRARSPSHHASRLSCPVIFFQGLDDKVAPPSQAETMVAALRSRGIPVAYLAFEGEGHGFRRAETLKRSLEAELYFYSRVLGFPLADPVEPVPIEGLSP